MKTEETRAILNFLEWECLDERTKKVNVYRTPFTKYIDKGKHKEVIHTNIPTNSEVFKKDWNFLMEVVEKIESLGYNTKIESLEHTRVSIGNGKLTTLIQVDKETKIKAVYNACVEFIKWYNEQQISAKNN